MKKWILNLLRREAYLQLSSNESYAEESHVPKALDQVPESSNQSATIGSDCHINNPPHTKLDLEENSFTIWIEVSKGKSEDALPILELRDGKGILAVFDGMGGAGAIKHQDQDGNTVSEAFIAAKTARYAINNFWKNQLLDDFTVATFGDITYLLKEEFSNLLSKNDKHQDVLKGSLIKRYPTTMAAIVFKQEDNLTTVKKRFSILSIWAGDSRCFVLDPEEGLRQISKDDLDPDYDPQSNITLDAPMSNCIHSGGTFHINHLVYNFISPFILLTATDGCFHYLMTPIHFEDLILRSMIDAGNIEQWKERMSNEISKYARDDASLSLIAVGFHSYKEMQEAFNSRSNLIRNNFISPVNEMYSKMMETQKQYFAYQSTYNDLVSEIWKDYRKSYYASFIEKYTE